MDKFASADYTHGQTNALVKLINQRAGKDGVERFLNGELRLSQNESSREWLEDSNVIVVEVTSDGATGGQWITRLQKKGFRVDELAKKILLSPDFKPTSGVKTKIGILKGSFFKSDRTIKTVRAVHQICIFPNEETYNLVEPNIEVTCLVREKFADFQLEDMGLVLIVAMHKPVLANDVPTLLEVSRAGAGSLLYVSQNESVGSYGVQTGFAYALSRAS